MDKKRINIMSSCDGNYVKHIPVQLYSIADSLVSAGKEVYFYFFHSQIPAEEIESLRAYADVLGIVFNEIRITETEKYAEIASKGGGWCVEAYFSLECHRYLPPEVDRIMYIDAADILIIGDIDEFYFDDFCGCSLLVTGLRYTYGPGGAVAYVSSDLANPVDRWDILRGLFNSGVYMINVGKLRVDNMSLDDFVFLKNELEKLYPDKDEIYYGDQGLISAAFVGDIKYFGFPETKNIWYQPYNFCIWFFDRSAEMCGGNPWYTPRVLHYCGNVKPWKFTVENEKDLKPGQYPFYEVYRLYQKLAHNCQLKIG